MAMAGGVRCDKVCDNDPVCMEQCYLVGRVFLDSASPTLSCDDDSDCNIPEHNGTKSVIAGYMNPDAGQPCVTDNGHTGTIDIRGYCKISRPYTPAPQGIASFL
jgi:hypothetical protein